MEVARGMWEKPVPVVLGSIGTIRNVDNNLKAASVLLHHWPSRPGGKHWAARRALLAAMQDAEDRRLLARARKAFTQAAKEADILVK
jgi:hypothetical protein